MSIDVTVYTLEAADGEETPYPQNEWFTYDYSEAQGWAQEAKLRVIANEYEWSDSHMLDDFTGEELCVR